MKLKCTAAAQVHLQHWSTTAQQVLTEQDPFQVSNTALQNIAVAITGMRHVLLPVRGPATVVQPLQHQEQQYDSTRQYCDRAATPSFTLAHVFSSVQGLEQACRLVPIKGSKYPVRCHVLPPHPNKVASPASSMQLQPLY